MLKSLRRKTLGDLKANRKQFAAVWLVMLVLANPLAGIQLAISQPIRIGDLVTVGDGTGRVEDLTVEAVGGTAVLASWRSSWGPEPVEVEVRTEAGTVVGAVVAESAVQVVTGAGCPWRCRAVVRGPNASGGASLRSGVAAADRVIVNGILNARPGEKVAPAERP